MITYVNRWKHLSSTVRWLCTNETSNKLIFQHEYDTSKQKAILEKLNASSFEEMKSITSISRSKKIIQHRTKYGDFTNLDQLLEVEGFGVKILRSMCEKILYEPPPEISENGPIKKQKNVSFIVPELSKTKIENLRRVVGVNVDPLSISWTGITSEDNTVFSLGYYVLPLSAENKRHNEIQLLEAAFSAFNQLPKADTYVLESSVLLGGTNNPMAVAINQQRLQLSVMLMVLLAQTAIENGEELPVILQKRSLWCRLYGTLVGSERVTAHSVVDEMLEGATGPYTPIKMPDHLAQTYHSSLPMIKEAFCSSLLLTLSFLDINVRQIPQCFKILRGRSKKPS